MVFRKSWTQFVQTILRALVWAVLIGVLFVYDSRWNSYLIRQGWSADVTYWLSLGLKVLFALGLVRAVWHLFWLRSFRIEVGDDLVSVRHGLLPWTKFQRHWDGDQMHECLVDSGGFWGWLLKSGDLTIVGSEGSTHKYRMPGIGKADLACGTINSMRRASRRAKR